MSKKKITKEELRSPDAFLSFADKVGRSLSEHWKPIAAAAAILLISGVGYTVMTAVQASNEKAASAALFEVEKKINAVNSDYAKKQQEAVSSLLEKDQQNEKKVDAKLAEIAKLDFDKDFAGIAAELEKIISQHQSTQSAQLSAIRLARLYIDYDQLEKAEAILRPTVDQAKKSTPMYALSRTLLASVLSYKDGPEESIRLLTEVLDDNNFTYLHAEVLLKLGIVNKEAGNVQRAEEMFRRVTTEFAETEAGKTAKNYLKMIRLIGTKPDSSNNASNIDL